MAFAPPTPPVSAVLSSPEEPPAEVTGDAARIPGRMVTAAAGSRDLLTSNWTAQDEVLSWSGLIGAMTAPCDGLDVAGDLGAIIYITL